MPKEAGAVAHFLEMVETVEVETALQSGSMGLASGKTRTRTLKSRPVGDPSA
jgi:hypothetical protein